MPIISNFPSGSGGGGSGIELAAISGLTTQTASGKAYFKWTDPNDTMLDTVPLAKWAGTLLVRKAGSMPNSRRDGVIVLDSKTRNAYKSTYFCDSGLSDGVTYYYKFFPYSTTGTYTDNAADEVTLTPNPVTTGNVTGITVADVADGKVYLKWNDPAANNVVDGVTLSTWASTKLVYKTGSYPTSPEDGTLVVNSTTRNQYSSNAIEVSGLTNETTYYFALFPISTEGAVNKNTANRITAVPRAVSRVLNENTWDVIRKVSSQNQGANYWSVGDRKAITIKGTVGTLSVNGTYYVYILGFNHNSSKEGNGIHFGGFKTALTGGADICLVDSYYNQYQSYNGTKYFQMNHWGNSSNYNTNYGGWAACDMRYDILGSTNKAPSGYGSQKSTSSVGYDAPANTATNPVANTLMAALPSDLRAVMQPMTKYTDNKGNSSNVAANVTSTIDYLPLLAEFEIFGTRSYANQYEQNQQAQYAYYSSGNSKVKNQHTSTGSAAFWWERSPYYYIGNDFCAVATGGSATNYYASYSFGVAPAFKV